MTDLDIKKIREELDEIFRQSFAPSIHGFLCQITALLDEVERVKETSTWDLVAERKKTAEAMAEVDSLRAKLKVAEDAIAHFEDNYPGFLPGWRAVLLDALKKIREA